MNFIQLCTQSTHPLVRKALERGGWELSKHGWGWWLDIDCESPCSSENAKPHHEAAVAWEMGAILIAHHPHRLDAIAIVVRAIMNEPNAKEHLVKAVEALEVEDA